MNLVQIIVLVGGSIGAKELIEFLVKRFAAKRDAREVERKATKTEVTAIEANTNAAMLDRLLKQMDSRIEGYEKSIATMSAKHEADIAEAKSSTRRLERKVEDLQTALRDWQLGNRVPRGQVLIPINDIKRVREMAPGILIQPWYPGEDDELDPSVVARITPIRQLPAIESDED